jgi:hypothetical protein
MFNRYNNYDKYSYSDRSPEEETNYFLKRYEAQAGLSRGKMYYKRQPIRYTDWIKDGSPMPFDLTVDQEPYVEINIPQHRFKELVEQEKYKRYLEERADYDARIVDSLRKDERVRDSNPAVQKAYEKYLMLLELAR